MRHQRIGSNLEWLLNASFGTTEWQLEAFQRVGLDPGVEYHDLEPDVVVVDRPTRDDQHHADRVYLTAEVVSDKFELILEEFGPRCQGERSLRYAMTKEACRSELRRFA
jgi:hypothetical protein